MYEIFEKLLKGRGITAYRFCKDTGVSTSTISTWKKKNSKIGMDLAETISNYFGVSIKSKQSYHVHYLIWGVGECVLTDTFIVSLDFRIYCFIVCRLFSLTD